MWNFGKRTAVQTVEVLTVVVSLQVNITLASDTRSENDHVDTPHCLRKDT
jgi:hypothetical protein